MLSCTHVHFFILHSVVDVIDSVYTDDKNKIHMHYHTYKSYLGFPLLGNVIIADCLRKQYLEVSV